MGLVLVAGSLAAQSPALTHLNAVLRAAGDSSLLPRDPANEAIYSKMEAVVRGLAKAIDNGADLVSFATVEDATLGHLVDVEQRVRELLVQRASDLLTDSDKGIIDDELAQLGDEVADTLKQTQFNTIPVFGPLFDDPILVRNALDPGRLTLEGVDGLLEFLNRQRTVAGTRARTIGYGIGSDQVAQVNALFLADQTRLLARLLLVY